MPLAMTRPWKHPKTGIYWLRRAVPAELRPLVGKREEKQSLQTRDPAEAKRRHALALAQIDERWAQLRRGPTELTEKEAAGIALPVENRWIALHQDNPSVQTTWRPDLFDQLWPASNNPFRITAPAVSLTLFDEAALALERMREWCASQADALLRERGLVVDDASRHRLERAIASATHRASVTLQALARGEGCRWPDRLAQPEGALLSRVAAPPVTFSSLIAAWAAERSPAPKTVYEWTRAFRQLAEFLGHDDARRLTPDNLISWKKSLVAAGQRPKTIRDAKLTPVRAVLQWATDNRQITTNPADRVTLDVRVKAGEGKRSFTDEEAAIILRAATKEKDPVRRWVPLLCCYSGARLAEVCQLRKQDVQRIEGVWCFKIDAEAGSLKTRSSERIVPLHPAVLDQGFLSFVERTQTGPLFADLSPDKFGRRGGNATKTLGRWVRGLGLTDGRLSPNHSWRHRFKTLGRRHGLAGDIVNAITGHSHRSVADLYGEFPIEAKYRELLKVPALNLSNSEPQPTA
ncbi:MAG TPA: site-specific integrase [Microvirga sp.]|jgi:integrase|nr:site-specific integrase [Microvirga sp.]